MQTLKSNAKKVFLRVRRKTEPTGPGENIELPKYFIKLHQTEPTGLGTVAEQKRKKCLVLDKEPYRYQQFISDIAGQDIQAHHNDVETLVRVVRNWLRTASGRQTIPGGNIIWERYQTFLRELPQTTQECQLDAEDMIFNDYIFVIGEWLKVQPSRLLRHSSRR